MNNQENIDSMAYNNNMWWIVLIQGIVILLLGLWILASPGMSLSVLLFFLGIYWIVIGVLHIIEAFTNTEQSKAWLIVGGILSILAGIFAVNNPFFGAILASFSVVIIVSIMVIVAGVSNIVRSAQGGGIGALILGILFSLIGFFLLFNPTGGIIALPILIGIMSVIGGIALIVGSFRLRSV